MAAAMLGACMCGVCGESGSCPLLLACERWCKDDWPSEVDESLVCGAVTAADVVVVVVVVVVVAAVLVVVVDGEMDRSC